MDILKRPFAAVVMAFACLGSIAPAHTQAQMPPASEQAQPNITDQKLDQTAAAVKRVASVKHDYQQRIAAAAPSDKERLAEEGVQELAKAVTDQGISVEEYAAILEVAQNDPGVLEKLKQRIRPSAD
jgi:hypothetical protein